MLKLSGILILVLMLSLVSAVEIETKDSFDQGETLIAKTSGKFFDPVSRDNVVFYRGHTRTSIIPYVEKIGNDFYIYAQLADKTSGNYSVVIKGARYFNGSKITTSDIGKNFTISENTADFSIDKGAVVANESFSIELENLQEDEITISMGRNESAGEIGGFFASLFGGSSSEEEAYKVILSAGETKKMIFDIAANGTSLQYITLNSENTRYEVPVYVFSANVSEENIKLRFEPAKLDISMATNSESHAVIYIVNYGEEEVEDIFLIVSDELEPYVSLLAENVGGISENFSKKVEFDVASGSEERIVKGNIAAIFGKDEMQIIIPVTLDFVKDYIPADGNQSISRTCLQLNGTICSESEECSGSVEYAKDGVCCLAECKAISKSSTGKVIGWLILIALIAFVAWFYLKRYRKVESVSDLMKVLGR